MEHQHLDNDAFDGTSTNNYLNDSQQYNAFDNLFPNHASTNSNYADAAWTVNNPYTQHSELLGANQDQNAWLSAQQHQSSRSPALEAQSHNTTRHSPLPNGNYQQQLPYGAYGAQSYNYQSSPQYDPSLLQQASQPFKQYNASYQPQIVEQQTTTIAPQALQQEVQSTSQPSQTQFPLREAIARPGAKIFDQDALAKQIPESATKGTFQIISFDKLASSTQSEKLAAFANIATEPIEWAINRAALPAYIPRKSKNELKRLAGQDPSLLAKITTKSAKRQRLVAKPGAKRERSTELSSDDESDYTSESDTEESPLPVKRPEGLKEGVEYDTIKALWRSKRKVIDANSVRQGLVDFWEVVRTIRDTWKADGEAVTDAEKKDKKAQLPVLKQRVKDQRDILEVALKTALKYGNRTIVETLSENTSLIFVFYQFLLDRFKAEDVNGSLTRTMLEVMTTFTTLTNEKMEKTHLSKVLPRYIKTGDAKTIYYAKTITTKAAAASEQARAQKSGSKDATEKKSAVKTEAVAGIKRPAAASEDAAAAKRAAVAATKPISSAKGVVATKKRPAEGDDISKPNAKKVATTSTSDAAAKAKPATSKLTSGLFAGLQSAAKKPGTSVKPGTTTVAKETAPKPAVVQNAAPVKSVFSFTETMKNLTRQKEEAKEEPKPEKAAVITETPEQKARRLRREARGVLRVHWKTGEDLVQVRQFVHDPDEEAGHDSSQTRDVADLKGEGRMFKQQHNSKLDIDDEEEDVAAVNAAATDETAMGKMVDWQEPALVDFSIFSEDDRKQNYQPYGGGRLKAESNECAEREKYEASTLSVYYSQPEDIPPNPSEPSDPITGDVTVLKNFGAPESKYLERARRPKPQQPVQFGGQFNQQSKQAPFPFPMPVPNGNAASGVPDISAILAQLGQGNNAAKPIPPPQQWPAFPPPQTAAPKSAPIDISAILAQLQGNAQPTAPAPVQAAPPLPPFFSDPKQAADFQAFVARQMAADAAKAGNAVQPVVPPASANNGIYENPERRKWIEENSGDKEQNGKRTNGAAKNSLYKTQICKFWHEGKCVKGDDCTYLHE